MCDNSFAVDFDNQVVAYSANLIALAEFHHALMKLSIYLQRYHLPTDHFAFAGDGPHVVRLLCGLHCILRRIESTALQSRASFMPRPLLRQAAYLLPRYRCTVHFHIAKIKNVRQLWQTFTCVRDGVGAIRRYTTRRDTPCQTLTCTCSSEPAAGGVWW